MFKPTSLSLAIAVALASSQAFAVNTEFDNFTPLTASAGPIRAFGPVADEESGAGAVMIFSSNENWAGCAAATGHGSNWGPTLV